MQEIGFGAESKVFLNKGIVIKKRFSKNYRIKEIDEVLRKSRTRIEAKILEKVGSPDLISTNRTDTVEMQYLKGSLIRDELDKKPILAKQIGQRLSKMHDMGIIHGDLTTSNMILTDEVNFIDFGLSYFSEKIEDKAVDIHLFKQALESKHYKVFNKAYKEFLKGYKPKKVKQILERLIAVQSRGRYKKK